MGVPVYQIGVPVLKAYQSLYIGTSVFWIFDFWDLFVSQIVTNEPKLAQMTPNGQKHAQMNPNLTNFPAGSFVFVFWLTSNFQGPSFSEFRLFVSPGEYVKNTTQTLTSKSGLAIIIMRSKILPLNTLKV